MTEYDKAAKELQEITADAFENAEPIPMWVWWTQVCLEHYFNAQRRWQAKVFRTPWFKYRG